MEQLLCAKEELSVFAYVTSYISNPLRNYNPPFYRRGTKDLIGIAGLPEVLGGRLGILFYVSLIPRPVLLTKRQSGL